jgi:hypothetical protein
LKLSQGYIKIKIRTEHFLMLFEKVEQDSEDFRSGLEVVAISRNGSDTKRSNF